MIVALCVCILSICMCVSSFCMRTSRMMCVPAAQEQERPGMMVVWCVCVYYQYVCICHHYESVCICYQYVRVHHVRYVYLQLDMFGKVKCRSAQE